MYTNKYLNTRISSVGLTSIDLIRFEQYDLYLIPKLQMMTPKCKIFLSL